MYDNEEGFYMEGVEGESLFAETYQSLSATQLSLQSIRATVEYGNKSILIMPTSALEILSRLNIMYPMMFQVKGEASNQTSYCGVLEFSAPEGVVYLPSWMLKSLKIRSGDLVELSNVALPLGTFIKIQPQSVDFLDITDPRAVLEHSLRNFAALTKGDCIAINYNNKIYELKVLEVKPNDGRGAVSVLETDLQVDFAPPVGYEEPTPNFRGEKSIANSLEANSFGQLSSSVISSTTSFTAFSGTAQKLSNRSKTSIKDEKSSETSIATTTSVTSKSSTSQTVPLNLPKGTLFFGGATRKPQIESNPKPDDQEKTNTSTFTAFSGKSNRLQ